MQRIAFVSLLIALIGLTACAGDIDMKPERRAQMHNIALITAVGDTVQHQHLTFFSSTPGSEKVDWKFDEIVESTARERLSAVLPPFNMVALPYEPVALAEQLYKDKRSLSLKMESYPDLSLITPTLQGLIGSSPVDTITLITGGAKTPQSQCSYGTVLSTEVHMTSFSPTFIVTCLSLYALDAKTMTVLSNRAQVDLEHYNGGGIFGPTNPAPFPAGFRMPLNDEQRAFLRPRYEKQLREMTIKILERAGF